MEWKGEKLAAVGAGKEVLVVAQVWSWGTGPEWRSTGVGNAGVHWRGYRASTVRGGHSGFVLQFFYPQAA